MGTSAFAFATKLKLQEIQNFVNNYLHCLTLFDTFFFILNQKSVKMIRENVDKVV